MQFLLFIGRTHYHTTSPRSCYNYRYHASYKYLYRTYIW